MRRRRSVFGIPRAGARFAARSTAVWLALASVAHAADPVVAVQSVDCGALDTNEVALILELELTDMAGSWDELAAPPVTLRCVGESLRIAVDDPVTGKHLSRTIPQPAAGGAGRERAIALAVSQLFLTSWLELLLPAEQRSAMPERPEAEVTAATARALDAVRARVDPPRRQAPAVTVSPRVDLLGGARLRDLRQPFTTVAGGLRVGVQVDDRYHLFAQALFETGEATRDRGVVDLLLGDFGVGAGYSLRLSEHLRVDAAAAFSALYVRLHGQPTQELVRGGSRHSAAAQAAVEVGPSLTFEPLRFGVSLVAGATLFAPEGTVSDERSVRPNGPFLSAQLSVGLLL